MNSNHSLSNPASAPYGQHNSRQFACCSRRLLHRSVRLFLIAGLASLVAQFPLQIHAQAFLFEGVAAGDYAGSLTVSAGSQTLRLTPEGFPNGSVTVQLRAIPLNQGVIANQGSTPVSDFFAPLRFTFTLPVNPITFGFLDAVPGGVGGDIDGSVTIRGFDSANNLLGTLFYKNPTYDGGTYQTLSGNFGGASYFIASTSSPSDNMNSLVYEIIDSTVVPEPSSLAMLLCCGATCGDLALRRRRAS